MSEMSVLSQRGGSPSVASARGVAPGEAGVESPASFFFGRNDSPRFILPLTWAWGMGFGGEG